MKRYSKKGTGKPNRSPRRSNPPASLAETPKIHKYLADLGLGSRRELEGWVAAGRVTVNGTRVGIGERVKPDDVIRVDGRRVGHGQQSRFRPRTRVLMYHKPVGELCARKTETTLPTVFEKLPRLKTGRWVSIGRLDLNTGGLLLFTNNGELAHRLMHPSHEIEREYAVRIRGEVPPESLKRLRQGVRLEDGVAKFLSIAPGGGGGVNQWFHVVIAEGRNREVRRLWESQGLQVSRLTRVRYGAIALPRDLRIGKWVDLKRPEVEALVGSVGISTGEL